MATGDLSTFRWILRLLESIPSENDAPGITVEQLRAKLADDFFPDDSPTGIQAANRRIQRALKAISDDPEWSMRLLCRVKSAKGLVEADPVTSSRQARYWKWKEPNHHLLTPGLSQNEALALALIQERLMGELPPATRDWLQTYFEEARRCLNNSGTGSSYNKWLKKIAVRPASQLLQPAQIDPATQSTVLGALHEEIQLNIIYQRRGQKTPSWLLMPNPSKR